MTIKIPQNNKYTQTNLSDLSGNVWYTRNVNFDEKGYLKLSPRCVSVFSDNSTDPDYDVDFESPTSIGRYGTSFYINSTERPFKSTLDVTTFSTTQDADTGTPGVLSSNSRAVWWQNRWYVTTQTKLYYKTVSGGAWTDTGITLTTGVSHPLVVFRNKDSLCIGNGNTVKLIDTSHSTTVTLTIPSDYEVLNLAFSNNKIGIITRLSTTADGQNQESYFFTWDGATATSSLGISVGANNLVGIVSYKGSFVVLSKTGESLYFNGGGFETLGVLPFMPKKRNWDSSDTYGDIMITDGDQIFFNVTGVLTETNIKQEKYQQNYPGGIWCYDKEIGLYHQYSPSISPLTQISVLDSGVSTSTGVFTVNTGNIPDTGSPIKYVFNTNTEIGGLKAGTIYYIIKINSTSFKLATTKQNAIDNNFITITSTGYTVNYFLALYLRDYGQTYLLQSNGIVTTKQNSLVYERLLFGNRLYNLTGNTQNSLQMSVTEFDNIGYCVTPRIVSLTIEDIAEKLYIKYSPLKTNDSITLKIKYDDVVGLPVSSTQTPGSATWTDESTLTTVADMSDVYTYLQDSSNECEIEIISGAGGGQLAKISSISYLAGTYTIILASEIEGADSGRTCNFIIDNFVELGTITSDDSNGYKEFPISKSAKWFKIKIIMKGTDITIEELDFINNTQIPYN